MANLILTNRKKQGYGINEMVDGLTYTSIVQTQLQIQTHTY